MSTWYPAPALVTAMPAASDPAVMNCASCDGCTVVAERPATPGSMMPTIPSAVPSQNACAAASRHARRPSQVIEYSLEPETMPPPRPENAKPRASGAECGAWLSTWRKPQETGGEAARSMQPKPILVLSTRCTGVYIRPAGDTTQ